MAGLDGPPPLFSILQLIVPSISQGYRLTRLAYCADPMAYKVFGSYDESRSRKPHFVMLTVGVDNTWRHVAVERLFNQSKWLKTDRYCAPLTTGCFLHSKTHVLSLNVETETFTETPFPAHMFPPKSYNRNCHHLSTGRYLSLLVSSRDWSWEVWEMKPETWNGERCSPISTWKLISAKSNGML